MKDFDTGEQLQHEEPDTEHDRFAGYHLRDMLAMHQPDWLLPDLLFEQQLAMLYGPPSSYKSFVALALVQRLVHGLTWQSVRLKPTRVIYVAGEGFPRFGSRMLAWCLRNRTDPANEELIVVRGEFSLLDRDDVDDFIERYRAAMPVGLVVFDTLSTMIAGENESDSAVMSGAIKNVKRIARKLGCAVLLVHHPGKDASRGARGHSSLLGNIDAEWTITRDENAPNCRIAVTKQKDGEHGQIFTFQAHSVPLGSHDAFGREHTSLVLEPVVSAGRTISLVEADRISIAALIDPGQRITVSALAQRLLGVLPLRTTAIRKRILAAVPPGEAWVKTQRQREFVELHHDYNGNGRTSWIECRKCGTGDLAP